MNSLGAKPVNWQSREIKTNASASSFKSIVDDYYWKKFDGKSFGSSITVTRKDFDAAGAETLVEADITKYVYHIALLRRIAGVTSDKMSIAKVKTKATITI